MTNAEREQKAKQLYMLIIDAAIDLDVVIKGALEVKFTDGSSTNMIIKKRDQ